MRLLLDENLSHRLLEILNPLYPGSAHVRGVGLEAASDDAVWQYATRHGLIIVSKDSDFHQRSLLFGHPPKVVWVRLGNCSTDEIAERLVRGATQVEAFDRDPEARPFSSWPKRTGGGRAG